MIEISLKVASDNQLDVESWFGYMAVPSVISQHVISDDVAELQDCCHINTRQPTAENLSKSEYAHWSIKHHLSWTLDAPEMALHLDFSR